MQGSDGPETTEPKPSPSNMSPCAGCPEQPGAWQAAAEAGGAAGRGLRVRRAARRAGQPGWNAARLQGFAWTLALFSCKKRFLQKAVGDSKCPGVYFKFCMLQRVASSAESFRGTVFTARTPTAAEQPALTHGAAVMLGLGSSSSHTLIPVHISILSNTSGEMHRG